MRYQAFLPLVTYPDPMSESAAINTIGMAARLEAGLHALAVNVEFPEVSNALSRFLLDTPQMIRDGEARSRRSGEALLAAISAEAGRAGVALTTGAVTAQPAFLAETAAVQARYFDFTLIGWEPDNETCRMTAEAIVFGAGRPTILLPSSSRVRAVEHIAIAWDGSRVAARALADATSLLRRAAQITVLTVVDDKPLPENAPGDHLARSLRDRGLTVQSVNIPAEDCPISTTLQEHANERGAELLVMGGYGHSRVRDFVLGGATKGVLEDLKMPVLLSH